jgi:hypothetical protein
VALVDLIVGDMEFDTSKVEKLENTRNGGYMLTTENEGYDSAKEERLRKENTLVHRGIHPLFDKTEEQLREHDNKIAKESEEQKRKARALAGFSTQAETGGSDDSDEVVVVYGSAKKRRFKIFTRENTGKKKYGGWSEEGIDKMERLVKEIRMDRGEDPGNGRVETSGAMRDKYWNFERAYYVWTTECVGGHNSTKKRKGQPQVKEREDNAIASLDSYKRKWLNKKQRREEERGSV